MVKTEWFDANWGKKFDEGDKLFIMLIHGILERKELEKSVQDEARW